MTINNYNYKCAAEFHKRLQELTIGDEVLIRVHPEKFSLRTLKKLHTRRRGPYKILRMFGSSTYELYIPRDQPGVQHQRLDSLSYFHEAAIVSSSSIVATTAEEPTAEEFVQSFRTRFHHRRHRHPPVVNFSKPERIDENH